MARYNLRDVIQAISIENVAAGTYLTTQGSKYKIFPSEAQPPILPSRTPVESNEVGDGRAYPKQSKPYYFNGVTFPYAMGLNSVMGARMLRMFLGGTISTGIVSTGGTDHTIQQKHPGNVPLVCNLLRKLGGEGYIFGDAWVQTLEISQSGAGQPRISGQFNNTGHMKLLSGTSIDTSTIVALPSYYKYHGAKTKLTFSDGFQTYDFASQSRLIDVGFTGSQNVIADQLPGDNFYDPSNQCYGAYGKEFYIDVQTGEIRAKVFMDASFSEFSSWLPNRKLTSVILTFSTCENVGGGSLFSEYEIKFPIAEFNLSGDSQGNFSAYSFNIRAIEGDASTGSLIIGRIRRATTDGALDEIAA